MTQILSSADPYIAALRPLAYIVMHHNAANPTQVCSQNSDSAQIIYIYMLQMFRYWSHSSYSSSQEEIICTNHMDYKNYGTRR